MAVKEKPAKFTSHGVEFDTREEAERHNELVEARTALEDAQRRFQTALAMSCKTADGALFEFGLFRDYWHIIEPIWSLPRLEKTTYFCRGWSVDEYKPDEVSIAVEDGKSERLRWVAIKDLYASEAMARQALRAAQEKWMAEMQKEIEREARN